MSNYYVRRAMIALLLAATLVAVLNLRVEEVPFVGRKRYTFIPKELEEWAGEIIGLSFAASQMNAIVDTDHKLVRYFQTIGRRLSEANGLGDYRFVIMNSPVPNAFVLPGKTVFIFTGILPYLHDEAGAAMVIAHEMSHCLAGHTHTSVMFMLPLLLLGDFFGGSLLTMALDVLLSKPNSRMAETEADTMGMYLAAKACYDPELFSKVFERMQTEFGDSDSYFDTHPSYARRISNLKKLKGEAQVLGYKDTCSNIGALAHFIKLLRGVKGDYLSTVDASNLPRITSKHFEELFEGAQPTLEDK